MQSLLVVSVFFLLSLLGAFVLFKFLKSSAIIKEKNYQAGGAIAGFLLIYGALYYTYDDIELSNIEDLKAMAKVKSISGVIVSRLPQTDEIKILLAVKHTDPDSEGKFTMSASCIDPELDEVRVYVLKENRYFSKMLTEMPADEIEIRLEE